MKLGQIKVVFLIALSKEIDLHQLSDIAVSIQLKSLIANNFQTIMPNTSILIIITGVGSRNAQLAINWIQENINPLYIINFGSCGSTTIPLGTTISCTTEPPPLTTFLPIISSLEDYIDMESTVYFDYFSQSLIPFYCIKTVTDSNNSQLISDFNRFLPTVQSEFKRLFPFVYNKKQLLSEHISVIIPTYNRVGYLQRCIESVINQTSPPKEIIVVDDGSSDKTPELLYQYKDKICILTLKQNYGVSTARNIGINHSTGDWIMLLDSDDEWLPNKISSQIKFLNQYPYYLIFQSLDQWIRHENKVIQPEHLQKKSGWIFHDSLQRCMISPSSVCFHRSLWTHYGPFNSDYIACEDYDLWLKITRHYPVGLDPTITLNRYSGHSDQLSSSIPILDHYRVQSLEKLLDLEYDPILIQSIKKVLIKKLTILSHGAKKRNKPFDKYQKTLAKLS